jgi:preprotein translocase subunit SecF
MAIRRESVIPLLTGVCLLVVAVVIGFSHGVMEAVALALVVGLLAGAYLARRYARAHLLYSRTTRSGTEATTRHRRGPPE